ALAQQAERAAIEVGDEVGVAVGLLVNRLEPVRVGRDVPRGDRVLPAERRVLPLERLRELDLPVERCERRLALAALLEPAAVALGLAAHGRVRELGPLPLAVFRLLRLEERGHRQVAEQPDLRQLELGLVPEVAQLEVRDPLARLADALPELRDLVERIAQAEAP